MPGTDEEKTTLSVNPSLKVENSKARQFTCRELSCLNKPENAHVAYRGKVYDVSSFISSHPGGVEQIMLGAGHDITHLFNAYHKPNTFKVLEKYYVGELIDNEMPLYVVDDHKESTQFYPTLKRRVNEHLKSLNKDPKIDYKMFAVHFLSCFLLVFSWWCMITWCDHKIVAVAFSILWGFFTVMIIFVLGHDISHFAVTHKPWVWTVVGIFTESLCGFGAYCWAYQHTFGHHVYTNIDGGDPDIGIPDGGIIRIKKHQRWIRKYRLQYIYTPLLYSLVSIKMKLQDFRTMIVLNKDGIRLNPPLISQYIRFYFCKLCHAIFTLVVPMLYMPITTALMYHVIYELVLGLWFVLVAQVNHVSTEVSIIKPDKDNLIHDTTWPEQQVLSTKDYATDSWLFTLLTGALNHQVAHHLFPGVLQSHYIHITPIVRQTCHEFGIDYHYEDNMMEAFKEHFKYLFKMGQQPSTNDHDKNQ